MAQTTTVAKATSVESPYRLDGEQTLKASRALLAHIENEKQEKDSKAEKPNLLASTGDSSDDEGAELDEVPIWLILTTKRHIINKTRLKPGKISIPHPLNTSPTSTICLITADPQRSFKDAIATPSFPADLRSRITRVISLSKLRSKYKSYESKRQLFNEHDVFLADDRVVSLLPNILGKVFYKTGIKRPITVSIAAENGRKGKEKEGSRMKSRKNAAMSDHSVASPERLAGEITKTLSTALVHLSPSTCTSVRVGKASWDATKVVENIEAVVAGLVTRFVPKGWRGVRSLHIKGPETAALPLWLADELWLDEGDILDDALPKDGAKAIEGTKGEIENINRKRKTFVPEEEPTARKKLKGTKKGEGGPSVGLGKEAALRREKLKKQKAEAIEEAEVAVATKGTVKTKTVDDGGVKVKTKKSKQ
ncbi:hypothetical protein GP486_001255 [Trichoglossum hirsutum]|uniref:Ribosomal protein L1 n=1 Tax=Trichoglossum hirsutum TaxID=265104 RepID=A0A9P8LHH6_9PEZI|nr:hypothetical protein GP486_001255 [Trichoglossum hirsutum]